MPYIVHAPRATVKRPGRRVKILKHVKSQIHHKKPQGSVASHTASVPFQTTSKIVQAAPHISKGFISQIGTVPTATPVSQKKNHIKIYGQRNSGTNFLNSLLRANFANPVSMDDHLAGRVVRFWKHGLPHNSLYKRYGSDALVIFVVRDLNSWLVSMFHNQYELQKTHSFRQFLRRRHVAKTRQVDAGTRKMVNQQLDNGKTIFEIRNARLRSYWDFYNNHNGCVLVTLSYLQNHAQEFLQKLWNTYELNRKNSSSWITNIRHTKSSKLHVQNRKYVTPGLQEGLQYADGHKNNFLEEQLFAEPVRMKP